MIKKVKTKGIPHDVNENDHGSSSDNISRFFNKYKDHKKIFKVNNPVIFQSHEPNYYYKFWIQKIKKIHDNGLQITGNKPLVSFDEAIPLNPKYIDDDHNDLIQTLQLYLKKSKRK